MTRPAIVIGLGGTGQWVLTFLKKDLLEVGGGKMPPGVKLIAFDTTSSTAARAGQGNKRGEEEQIRAGAIELTPDVEFIPVGENVTKLAQEIAEGQHPHLQWYPAKTYFSKLSPSAFNLKFGSGQIRQMGRIALFQDVSARGSSQIIAYIRQAIEQLQGQVSRDKQLEIIIVSSLAGGTGAGMLVDIALLVRAQASKQVEENYMLRGFFVLPRAFASKSLGEGRDMLARSFAAWRELDRFMIVSKDFGLRQVNYHETNQDLRIPVRQRAYDVSYLVDPARHGVNSLDTVNAEVGIYPGIAYAISAILDEKAGQPYTEFVTMNLTGKLSQLPRRPYHSAIGSYTLKVPVYFASEKFSHELALEVLKELLAPEFNDKGRVTKLSELRNQEAPSGAAGLNSVLDFLSSTAFNVAGNDIPNTLFLPLVADVRKAISAQKDGELANQVARGGLSQSQNRWVIGLTNISQDPAGKLIAEQISRYMNRLIWSEQGLAPSAVAGDTPAEAYTRLVTGIPRTRAQLYGVADISSAQQRGEYGTALQKAQEAQLERFKMLFSAWTLLTLNGTSTDPRLARGGKIGFVRAFYDELYNTFNLFLQFLNKVRKQRNEVLRLRAQTHTAAERAQMRYKTEGDKKCWLTFWDHFVHPEAHQAQREYLKAEQRDMDVRKDDILLDVYAETALQMMNYTEKSRDQVDIWISHLATGDPGQKIPGVYGAAVQSLENVNVNHALDKDLNRVSQIIGEHEYRSDPKYVIEALGQLTWKVAAGEEALGMNFGVEFPGPDFAAPPRWVEFRREGENVTQHNLNLLLQMAERPYKTLHQERPLAREVVPFYPTGQNLAESIDKLAEPMYKKGATPEGPQVVACYVRVHSEIDDQTTEYFKAFRDELSRRNPKILKLAMEDSEDHHKLTIVRSDDLLPSTDFEMWHACQEAYIQKVTDPYQGMDAEELHVFPAEINACYYEREMPVRLLQNYHTLHPEVVALLEDREHIDMFFRAVALGFIKQQVDDKGQPFWTFQLKSEDEPLFITVPPSTQLELQKEDIFQVIHNFAIEGSDRRPGKSKSLIVDWLKLRDAILTSQRELGKPKAIELYQQEISGPNGIVQRIKSDVDLRRSQVPDASLRSMIFQEHDDLADLAQVIYLKAIDSVKTF